MKTLTIATLLLSTALSAPAFAETTDEIIVTARKTEERLNDVPVSVRVVDEEEIRKSNILRVENIPGFSNRMASVHSEALLLSMHGQNQTDPHLALDGTVGVYIDGIYVARSIGLNSNLLDVKNVEILSGPQGTLFGRNSTGGALIINTNDPKLNVFEGNAEFSYGRYNEFQETAVVNIPVSDTVAVRFAGNKYDRDGIYTNSVTGEKLQWRDSETIRGKVLFEPSSDIRAVLSAEYSNLDSTDAARTIAFGWPNTPFSTNGRINQPTNTVANDFPTPSGVTYRSVSLNTDIGNLKVVGGWRRLNSLTGIDFDGTSLKNTYFVTDAAIDQFTAEANYSGNLGNLKYIAGAFYFDERGDDNGMNAQNVSFNYYGKNISSGVFLNGSYPVGNLTVNAGVRYTHDDKTGEIRNIIRNANNVNIACMDQGLGLSLAKNCLYTFNKKFDNVSWTAGLDYRVNPETLVYAKVSTGFKSGGINKYGYDAISSSPISPEKITEYQVGVKGDVGPVTYSIAGFYNKTNNLQISVFYPFPYATNVIRNAAESEAWGGEVSVAANITDRLSVRVNGILVNPKYISYINPRTGADDSGSNFNMVIRKQVDANATYDAGFARFNVNYVWTGKYANTGQSLAYLTTVYGAATGAAAYESAQVPANSNLNLRVDVPISENVEFSAWGRNVTNSRFYKYVLMSERSWVAGSMNDPVTYGVSIRAKF